MIGATVLLDTGPLVAYLDRRDHRHRWAVEQFASAAAPMLTCESVISEACFITRNLPRGVESVLRLLQTGAVLIPFSIQQELDSVMKLAQRYSNVPMALADACLVRMSELIPGSVLLTLDSDFHVYRRNRRQKIPLLMPLGD